MQKSIINPWQWQNQLGYAQAVEVIQPTHTLYCAGQAAMDADGRPIAADMSGQIDACLDNLETVLQQAGYSLANVVRINFYTTSVPQFFAAYGQVIGRLSAGGCVPASTLVEVNALAFPELMVEIEATAVK
ncbi:RidA family protein [Spirosoma validum]|uniref:RidA family protein n=1 Tax=Spirosoma validum TaxID=2771355 RepID=A0A927B0D8_9BACT|nr:RidA family protein [Spirosoma validum]MBD2753103.1 RidA family protein [Spirosoma validum]